MGKVGRNDPCPCGSGKKYKRCCERSGPVAGDVAPGSKAGYHPRGAPVPYDPSLTPPVPPWVTPQTIRYPPVGRCIYCDADTYEPGTSRRLGDEHIIPEGLGGHLLLPEASCKACEAITSGFEGQCLQRGFGPMRLYLNMPSKRPKDRPTTLPVIVNSTPTQDGVWAEVPVHMYPVMVPAFQYNRPVMLGGPGIGTGYDTIKFHCLLSPLDLDRRVEVIRRHLNVDRVQLRWDLAWCWQVLRMVAKIAHGYLSAEVGHGKFSPLLLPSILHNDPKEITRFVGQLDEKEDRSVSGHSIGRGIVRIEDRNYHVVRLRLFGAYGLPEYVAVTGEVL
jgi:SEC-C motif